MNIEEQDITGCLIIERKRYNDDAGSCQEIYSTNHTIKECDNWQQMNLVFSKEQAVRGIYWSPYGKLITCIQGKAFNVVVDLRPKSPTFKKWMGWWLSADESKQIYIPPLCGYGHFAAVDSVHICLQESIWHPNADRIIFWEDPTIDVKWPNGKHILSEKDRTARPFDQIS